MANRHEQLLTAIAGSDLVEAKRLIRGGVDLKDALRYDIPVKDYTYYDLSPELNGSSQTSGFGGPVVSEVVLPDGRKYKLSYNQYAELARVELPTGGAIEYDYESGSEAPAYPASGVINNQIYRRVVKRRIYLGGGRGAAYSTQTVYGKGNPTSEITYDAAGNRLSDLEHTFNGDPSAFTSLSAQPWYESGSAGRVAKTEVFSIGDGPRTLMRRVENTYTDYPHTVPVGITNLSGDACAVRSARQRQALVGRQGQPVAAHLRRRIL